MLEMQSSGEFSGGIEGSTVSLDIKVQKTLGLIKTLQDMPLGDYYMHFHRSW